MGEIEDLVKLLYSAELGSHASFQGSTGNRQKLQSGGETVLKQFDVFLGYNKNDKTYAIKLAQELEKYGFHVWKTSRQEYLVRLRRGIAERYGKDELRTLCFDLEIGYDDLPGEGNADKARELVAFFDRRDRISGLVSYLEQDRSNVIWGDPLGQTGCALYEFRGLHLEELQREVTKIVRAAMLIMGPYGVEPWDRPEVHDCLAEFSRQELPLFLALLPGAPDSVGSSAFLRGFTQVDLRTGIHREALTPLVWHLAMETGRELAVAVTESRINKHGPDPSDVDAWGIASIKSRLHALSEIVAREATQEAAIGAAIYQHDALTVLAPLILDLRWGRGYASALERLLTVQSVQKHLRDFHCKEVTPPCAVMDGVLSAEKVGADQVLIRLDGNPAVIVYDLAPSDMQAVSDTVRKYGRLGIATTHGLSLLQRIGDIPISGGAESGDALKDALVRNKNALIPLVARFGLPGSEWLLSNDEEFPEVGKRLLETILPERGTQEGHR
jgi:hypothetical protein